MEAIAPYQDWIILAVVGLVAGWIVGQILGGGGLLRNLIVGIIGALIGGWLAQQGLINIDLGFGPLVNNIAVATVGALILVIIGRLLGGR